MTTASFDRPAAFRIGRVFSDTFGVLSRNLGLSIGLAALFSGLPTFLYELWTGGQVRAAQGVPPQFDAASIITGLVAFLIYMVLASILTAALMRVTIEDLNGQTPTFSDALNRGIAVVLPVIGLSILMYLGFVVGFALLIIPGIYLLIRWAAAIPALVHERLGVLASMKRSAELTKGSRWRILGLFVILIIAIWGLNIVVGLFLLAIVAAVGTFIGSLVVAVISAVSSVIGSIAMAVTYVELRYVKEGTDVKELAEIFA